MPAYNPDGSRKQPNPLADPKLKPEPGVNIRRARAGALILQGKSLKQALLSAGYAETTASNPTAHGLTANECLREAAKLDKRADPSTLLASSRRLSKRLLQAWLDKGDSALTEKVGALAIPRLIEVMERYHNAAGEGSQERDARSFVERAFTMRATIAELERRGMLKRTENVDSRDSEPRLIGASKVPRDSDGTPPE